MSGWKRHITGQYPISPLVSFRVLFGLIMFISTLRFMLNGWIDQFYVQPVYLFTYLGFDWVQPLDRAGMYAVFIIMAMSALGIMAGWKYRLSALIFFLTFNYVELLDKSLYLNHYYFISLMSFLLLLVPAGRSFSLDTLRNPQQRLETVPAWCVNIFRLQLGLVYFYAGVAKLNYSWLIEAQPLAIWLPAHSDLPFIGPLLAKQWVAYAFSWAGALYDIFIPFLLVTARTRLFAYSLVVVFHVITRILFPIGMFPFIMILSTLIFFSPAFHDRIQDRLRELFSSFIMERKTHKPSAPAWNGSKVLAGLLCIYFAVQIALPWRYMLYPGNLFWTEEGYRYSWRVMLMEKAGYATFYVKDPQTGREAQINNQDYLAPHQEKQMSTQPDMILQFARFIEQEYKDKGVADPQVRVEAHVALNGSRSRLLIDPQRDLTLCAWDMKHRDWITEWK